MGSRELNHPRSKRNDQTEGPWEQGEFGRGMVKNAPHDDIPEGAVAGLINCHAYPTEIQPRLASYLWSDLQPPALEGRTAYKATKTGNVITSASGGIFTADDVSNYFVWPGDPNYHDEIIEYVSSTKVRTRDSGDRAYTTGCWMHAKRNLHRWHRTQHKIVDLWGTEVYITDSYMTAWTKALCISVDQPQNAMSDWSERDDYGVIFNSGGRFIVDFSLSVPIVYRENTPVPSVLIESNVQTLLRDKRYDYLYSMSRISGNGFRTRTTPGCSIILESGTNALNPNTSPPRDYGSVWAEKSIDSGVKIQGRLTGTMIDVPHQTPTYWNAITDATFNATINGINAEFMVDFSPTGYNVGSLSDVAKAIQETLRLSFPFATCEFNYEGNNFVVTSGEEDGSTVGFFALAVLGGTDIVVQMHMLSTTGATIDNDHSWAQPLEVGILAVPENGNDPTIQEQHHTHYSIYRTCNIGPDGNDPRTGSANSPFKFTWVYDLRIAGAFYAYRMYDGRVVALVGEFEPWDVGTPLVWEDGEVDTIEQYIDAQTVSVLAPGEGDYGVHIKKIQAAAIGGGRVIRATQSGNIVTRLGGSPFTAADERKTLTWADGYYSYITEYLSPDSVIVLEEFDRPMQGVTIDPTERLFSDQVPDDDLRDRQGEVHIGLLQHRFYFAMPNANVGAVVPGFLLAAVRGQKELCYSQLGISKKYTAGYYLENRQKIDRIEDDIQAIWKMPNKFIVFCTHSTWGGPTNIPDIKKLPEFGEAYATLHVDIIDERIGVRDIGSIREVDEGILEMRCSDGTFRQFNGIKYSADMTVDGDTGQDIVQKDFNDCYPVGASVFGRKIGHVWWGLRK